MYTVYNKFILLLILTSLMSNVNVLIEYTQTANVFHQITRRQPRFIQPGISNTCQ